MEIFSPTRIKPLQTTARNARGRYVVYWMQQSQRALYNHALEFAVHTANQRHQPLLVLFGLTDGYPEANWRHYAFMLEGLQDVQSRLADRGIAFQIVAADPAQAALQCAVQASVLICDRGYLRHQRNWRRHVALNAPCPVIQVESDVIVPVEAASQKVEYAARTLRPRIQRLLSEYLKPLDERTLRQSDRSLGAPADFGTLLSNLTIHRNVKPVASFMQGGYTHARKQFDAFLSGQLARYDSQRNHPQIDGSSMMSPFLHFGHISPLAMALAVQRADAPAGAKSALLEELIVRRELAINYVYYCPNYDEYDGLPHWARRTLAEHRLDRREPGYSIEQLEAAATHDPYWNAAMLEMKHTGYMHTYMRMYWGKKILQWLPDPRQAFHTVLRLNNKYFIDGRDPNSYAGVGWVFGLHDQAWKERRIFGKIRYMARSGLERKFDMQGYIAKIQRRIAGL